MATIRRKLAVVDFGKCRLSGFVAWLLWDLVQVYWLFSETGVAVTNGLALVLYAGSGPI
jgi:NADH dehydrogenase FAD-containing subunit